MSPSTSPPQVTHLPALRSNLSRLSARNLRRPTRMPRGRVGSYIDRLKWLFTGSAY